VQGALLVKNRSNDPGVYKKLADILRDCADREQEIFTRLKTAV